MERVAGYPFVCAGVVFRLSCRVRELVPKRVVLGRGMLRA